jgi:threonine synthase
MLYLSTRGHPEQVDFREVTLRGLAPDGGLYVPERWPRLCHQEISDLKVLSYSEIAARILAEFAGNPLPVDELEAICSDAYADFDHPEVAPTMVTRARRCFST